MELCVRNVNQAYRIMMQQMHNKGLVEDTRNGPAFVFPEPVLTCYSNPTERVLWDSRRNANPFFHLMEALWMLAGRNDVHFLELFNRNMANYSDDSETLYGAYGYRWHYFFGINQLDTIIRALRYNTSDRRLVLTMWSPKDLGWNSKDIPCNTQCYFRVNQGKLEMTVTCRSNDMIWGAYGTNYVHFSFLQEYVAAMAGLPVGRLYHFSHNFHAYTNIFSDLYHKGGEASADLYTDIRGIFPPLVDDPYSFLDELRNALCNIEDMATGQSGLFKNNYKNQWLYNAEIMASVWLYRHELTSSAIEEELGNMSTSDWALAAKTYIARNCNVRK